MFDVLDRESVQAALATKWVGRHYLYRETAVSTNDELKATSGLPDGAMMLAEYQSRGRGRLDRRWEAPPGTSLLFSLLLRPNWSVDQNNWLAMIGSLAVVESIGAQTAIAGQAGVAARIKWPNDVILRQDGVWHKIGGLLLEGNVDTDGRCRRAILGIGLNVNIPRATLPVGITPPTSLLIATGRPLARLPLLADLLARLEVYYEAARRGHSPLNAWRRYLLLPTQPVTVTHMGNSRQLRGTAVDVNAWGHLLLRAADGAIHTIMAGDVTLRPDADSFDNSMDCHYPML